MSEPAFRRIVRRETHSPRTVAMIIAVSLSIIALVWLGVEIVLSLAAQPPLLVGPGTAVHWIVGLPRAQPQWLVVAGGVLLGVVGVVFVVLAVAPGRLPRHEMVWDGRAVVVDNGVVAAALAQHISDETGISRDEITVGVAHRAVDVTLRPGLGEQVDAGPVQELVDTEVAGYQLNPPVKTRVRVIRPTESERTE